jgi:hypothetical protein
MDTSLTERARLLVESLHSGRHIVSDLLDEIESLEYIVASLENEVLGLRCDEDI